MCIAHVKNNKMCRKAPLCKALVSHTLFHNDVYKRCTSSALDHLFDVHFRNVNLSVNTFTYIVQLTVSFFPKNFCASRLTSTQTTHCHQCAISCLHTAYHFAEITLPEAAEATTLHNTAVMTSPFYYSDRTVSAVTILASYGRHLSMSPFLLERCCMPSGLNLPSTHTLTHALSLEQLCVGSQLRAPLRRGYPQGFVSTPQSADICHQHQCTPYY